MSFKAVFQFILNIHEFKNIDLPNQGLAAISASIYKQQKGKQQTYAIPYQFPYNRTYKLNKSKIRDDSLIEDMFFRSKVVQIKYSDQIIRIDDFVQFRMDLEAFPTLSTDNVFLELNLIFSNRYYATQQERFDGKPVALVRMRLKDIENGLISYAEADFKQDYFSKASFTLYGQLMYYKFQKYQLKTKDPSNKQISRSKIQNFGKLLIWAKQNILQAGEDPFDLFYSNYVKNLRHSNYLTQTKLNTYLTIKRKVIISLPQKYTSLIGHKKGDQISDKQFRKYLQSYKQPLSIEDIPQQIQQIRIENFLFLNQVIKDFQHDQFEHELMKLQYDVFVREKFGERVFRNTLYSDQPNIQNVLKQNKKIAKQMRNKNYTLTQYPIQNQIFQSRDQHEFIFYEVMLPSQLKNQQFNQKLVQQKPLSSPVLSLPSMDGNSVDQNHSSLSQKSQPEQQHPTNFFSENPTIHSAIAYQQANMLVILCHGFQGSSYDMAIIHKGIKNMLPTANYLVSRKNQDGTEGDIQKMGEKLADQIKYYVRAFMNEQTCILNFVGHSMGGIIARSSFKHLNKFKQQFGFFCSLSSPHLGYLNGVDNKIRAGLWVLRKWKPIISLDQLSMQQTKNPRKSFLYHLSKQGTLKNFRKLIFFSSFEDSYVSWHSARICAHLSKNQQSRIQNEMVQNILGQPNHSKSTIHRLDINFNVKANNIDSLIGRAAHINLIIQDTLFDVVNVTLPKLFQLREYMTGVTQ